MQNLPIPTAESLAHSAQLADMIRQRITQAGGWISFADFMHAALYTPGLGYYSGGAQKFGQGGDFVTAPEISPLFAQSIARQASQVLAASGGAVLELGAGTGRLAADLLLELERLEALPGRYYILEVSDHLRQIQLENLQKKLSEELFRRVVWLNDLPQDFVGLIFGNEVLDALPVHIVTQKNGELFERGVSVDSQFIWQDKPLQNQAIAQEAHGYSLAEGYVTECCPAATGLVRSLADCLQQGAILLIDYGFPAREYYHPQRREGTLMCHFQHYAHSDPLIYVGLQDITAHVNFTQIASAYDQRSMRLAGYTTQAQFLMNCGMLDILAQHSPDSPHFMQLAAAAQKYLSPAEMGELFKVIAFTKNLDLPLIGFVQGDKSHTL